MSKQVYSAGWNLPGCLPDSPPALFESEEEANAYIKDERESANEMYAEAAAEAADSDGGSDPYHYFVEMIEVSDEEWDEYQNAIAF